MEGGKEGREGEGERGKKEYLPHRQTGKPGFYCILCFKSQPLWTWQMLYRLGVPCVPVLYFQCPR